MTEAASAVAFLRTLFHGVEGDIYLCSLPNQPGAKPGEKSLRTRDQKAAKAFIERWDKPGRGLFFCIGTLRPDAKPTARGSYRSKANIWRLPVLPIDIDFRGMTLDNPQAAAIGMLERSRLPPQLIVLSGGGLHAYWRLAEVLEPEAFPAAELMLRQLIARFGSDPAVCDVSRLMRLPGTTNSKYDDERLVRVLKHSQDGGHAWQGLQALTQEPPAAVSPPPPPTLAKRQAPASEPGNAFEAYGQWKPPIDIEAALSAMHYPGNVHTTQLAVTAAYLNAGHSLEDTVALVLNATAAIAPADWDMQRERQTLENMGNTWLEKHPPTNVVSFPLRLNGGNGPAGDLGAADKPTLSASETPPKTPAPVYFSSFTAAALAEQPVPELQFLVEQLIPTGEVTLLYGDGGTGKSLLALMLAVQMQLRENLTWLGLPISGGRCLVYSAEDRQHVAHIRLADICKHLNIDLNDLPDLEVIPMAGHDATLAVPSMAQQIVATGNFKILENHIARLEPALVIIDTAADVFGGNEIDRRQVRQFLTLLSGLAMRHDTTILLCAQPSLAGLNSGSGTSGSTAWNNSARSRLYLERMLDENRKEPDVDVRMLRCMKANYAQRGFELQLRWQDGVFVPQLAPGASSLDRSAARDFADDIFLKMLNLYARENRPVSDSRANTYAPALFAADPRAEGVSKQRLVEAMNRLFQQQKIKAVETGPPSRRRRQLVSVP